MTFSRGDLVTIASVKFRIVLGLVMVPLTVAAQVASAFLAAALNLR